MDRDERRRLGAELRRRHPWVDDDTIGPAAVEAGECDRCGSEARMVMTCGPIAWPYLGRRCALELGDQAWCEGHADVATDLLARCRALPGVADTVARLWWVATGEVAVDPALEAAARRRLGLPAA
jgi:hypothetical protein